MLGKYVLIDSVYVNPVASDTMTNRIRYIKLCLRKIEKLGKFHQ